MKRKLFAVLLAVLMVLSLLPAVFAPETAVAEVETYAQETVQGGAILHCFNWSYNEIRTHLPEIAAAGYTAVQTSPVQEPKDYTYQGVVYSDSAGQWWKLYQPLDLCIADGGTWLGTRQDLIDLCTAADNYGIKVIVDIVSNHLANTQTGGTVGNLSPQVPAEYHVADYFHGDTDFINDSSRYTITHYHMGMPDLNTGNSVIQQKVLDLLKDCIDCGVDGFRFDAAKHIELPTDPADTRSNFWPTVIDGAKNYAQSNGVTLFVYGEILGGAGTDIANYTQYMAVTDNETGNSARESARYGNAAGLANYSYYKGSAPEKSVLWAESHDTYEDGSTDGISDAVIVNTWAIVGARADSTSLFLARPNETMGLASSDTTWNATAVAEVNKFKNHFDGTTEYLSSYGSVAYIERGTNGAVLSKLDGGGSVSVPVHKMQDGAYDDQVTGNSFTVQNGVLSGTVGPSGVAVIYNPGADPQNYTYISVPKLYLKPNDNWLGDGAWFAAYFFGEGNAWERMEATGDGCYSADVPDGKWTNVIFVRMSNTATDPGWSGKWNQTVDLVPSAGTDCFTIESGSGDSYTGSWSKYAPSGYYLVGNMTGWAVNQNYKLAVSPDDSSIYRIDLNLTSTSEFKVVKSTSGSLTWYPDGTNNNCTVNESGSYTVLFDPRGGVNGWHAGYISATKTGDASAEAGYYLVGNMTNWNVDAAYKLVRNDGASTEEYSIDAALTPTSQFKIVYSADGTEKTQWFPDPSGNYGQNGEIPANGTYHVYFRPKKDGNADWFYNFIYMSTTHTVHFSVPDGVTAPDDISCSAGESITLPDAAAPEGYTFVGWVTEDYNNTATQPDVLTGEYVPTADVTLKALYSYTMNLTGSYQLVTAAPDTWEGSYVITYGKTDALYALKGLAGTRKYESVSAGGAIAFADTGMTLDGEVLTGAADAYVFTVEAKDGKFTIRSAETGTYLASRGGYLTSYKTDAASYDRWSLAVNGTAAEATNGASRKIPYLGFSANNYFMISRTANPEIFFWKLAPAQEATVYTTVID